VSGPLTAPLAMTVHALADIAIDWIAEEYAGDTGLDLPPALKKHLMQLGEKDVKIKWHWYGCKILFIKHL